MNRNIAVKKYKIGKKFEKETLSKYGIRLLMPKYVPEPWICLLMPEKRSLISGKKRFYLSGDSEPEDFKTSTL